MTSLLVLVLLAGVWAAVLVPPYLRRRSETVDSIGSFQRHLSTLRRAGPVPLASVPRGAGPALSSPAARPLGGRRPASPAARAAARRRRRDVLVALLAAAAFTLLLALAFGGGLWLSHVAVDGLLGGYVYLLVQLRKAAEDRVATVRYLPTPATPRSFEPAPAFALRRVAR